MTIDLQVTFGGEECKRLADDLTFVLNDAQKRLEAWHEGDKSVMSERTFAAYGTLTVIRDTLHMRRAPSEFPAKRDI